MHLLARVTFLHLHTFGFWLRSAGIIDGRASDGFHKPGNVIFAPSLNVYMASAMPFLEELDVSYNRYYHLSKRLELKAHWVSAIVFPALKRVTCRCPSNTIHLDGVQVLRVYKLCTSPVFTCECWLLAVFVYF